MSGLIDSGYANELLDDDGNYILFTLKDKGTHLLQNHPTAWERIQKSMGTGKGWFIFGISILDGFHSVTLLVNQRIDETQFYLVDQMNRAATESGYYEFEGMIPGARQFSSGADFDSFIDYAVTDWGLKHDYKRNVRIWRIKSDKA